MSEHRYADLPETVKKGAVENLNRLVRRFYAKGTDFSKVSEAEVRLLQWKLTHYPRPSDNYAQFLPFPA